jgi:hypothetical protein
MSNYHQMRVLCCLALAALVTLLAPAAPRAETVTTHVWLVGAGSLVHTRGVIELSRPGRLRDVVPSVRALLGLPKDRARRAGSELCGAFRPCAD